MFSTVESAASTMAVTNRLLSDASRSYRQVSLLVITDHGASWGLLVSACESSQLPACTFVLQRA